MWSCMSWSEAGGQSPSSRSKHSVTLLGDKLYLLAGRNGNIPLKDMWTYSLSEGRWQKVEGGGERPPCLQEHTAIPWKDSIYVFGGEIGFSSCNEPPLWIYNSTTNTWRKVRTAKGAVPKGRRGHTATLYRSTMLVYGGYRDLRGSSNELWAFHFETETWHLLSSASRGIAPPARHKHSMVLHDDAIWIYGGMTDLQERADLWRFDLVCKRWVCVKTKVGPGPLHSHAACKLASSMLLFGGERSGQPNNELWKFHFGTETWERIVTEGMQPHARSESVALKVPGGSPKCRNGSGATTGPERLARGRPGILRELTRLSQLSLGQRCAYSQLGSDDSVDTFELKTRVVLAPLPRDPVSVPNFATAMTPIETAEHIEDRGKRPLPKSSSVRFSEVAESPEETSDYASLEAVREAPLSFENPNYDGPATSSPPDSGVDLPRPDTLKLVTNCNANLDKAKKRAASAGRVENEATSFSVFIIGGKEKGQVTVFKRPLSFWKLQLNPNIY